MNEFPIEIVLSLLGIVVASAAFLREFVLVGRRRLGYRVQMDTPVTGETESALAGALRNLRTPEDGGQAWELANLSLVLVRIENAGSLRIDDNDYTMRNAESDRVGLHLVFPERKVIGLAVNELSGVPADNLGPGSGLGKWDRVEGTRFEGLIDLPKVPLERGHHYKILAILNREQGTGEPKPPTLIGAVKGGKVAPTESKSGPSVKLMALCAFLVAVVVVQLVVALVQADPPPRDCAAGELTVVGSTAMAPMIRKAAQDYEKTCTDAKFSFAFEGTEPGLRTLARAGHTQNMLAIGDGSKGNSFEALTEHPLALGSFSMIVHPGVGLTNLTTAQIRDLYRGNIKNWNQIGGPDLPVVLIDRTAGSGTRRALESRLLEDNRKVFPYTSCIGMAAGGAQCEVDVTEEVAAFVAKIPGAVGYLETSAVGAEVRAVSIDGASASADAMRTRRYPFVGVEYALTHGPIAGDSLVTQFIDYLANGKARLTMVEFGNIPCSDRVDLEICTA
ncbi:PstS family phosphate ABC transporter substrate-binding protein [Nocardia sp. A7]|uniref:PstS family phosphate ABC transporter substrate-binding protein n=1 Tax=Nocardia sp. A7 TaxID=2789274 RepID=UPI00397C8266